MAHTGSEYQRGAQELMEVPRAGVPGKLSPFLLASYSQDGSNNFLLLEVDLTAVGNCLIFSDTIY